MHFAYVNWGHSLVSHHGLWCAWCLKDFENEKLELHHMMPIEATQKLLHWDFKIPWVVPAHFNCHRDSLQIQSGGIYSLIQRFASVRPEIKSELSRRLHESGYYWIPILLNSMKLQDGNFLDIQAKINLFKSAAGVVQGKYIVKKILRNVIIPVTIDSLIAESNLDFSSGSYRRSKLLLEKFDGLKFKEKPIIREMIMAAYLRRKAQLYNDRDAANEAFKLTSKEDPYTTSTAILQLGWIEYTKQNFRKASDYFEQLQDIENLTWLYRAESLLGYSMCSITLGIVNEEIYSCLVGAQYIYTILGIIGPSIRFLSYSNTKMLTPTQILLSQRKFYYYSKQLCYEIRLQVIKGKDRSPRLKKILGTEDLTLSIFDTLISETYNILDKYKN
jgi:hypothetical protein